MPSLNLLEFFSKDIIPREMNSHGRILHHKANIHYCHKLTSGSSGIRRCLMKKAHMKEIAIFPSMQRTLVESTADCGPLVNLVTDEVVLSGLVIAKSCDTKKFTILILKVPCTRNSDAGHC